METVLYTTTDKIRASIGVSDIEPSDKTIADISVEEQLMLFLDSVYPLHEALEVAAALPGATALEKKAMVSLRLVSQYHGAICVMVGAQYLFEATFTDGGTTKTRFNKSDLETTLARLYEARDRYLYYLNPDYAGLATGFKVFTTSTPDYDPVTNVGGAV